MNQLKDKVAIVTGGSRGIGKATAQVFAREGATVVICGRKQNTVDEVAAEFKDLPGRVVPMACHVGKLEELERLVDTTTREFGKIDIVVNNAATNIAQGPAIEMDDGQFDKMVEVNLKSAYRLTRLAAPGMCRRGNGSIINIASIAGLRPQFHGLLYSMTKAA
ncbi:MAG: SDR family NAD(P)-dependent oxidoreductase, partial [Bryobacteraceae bacterium]